MARNEERELFSDESLLTRLQQRRALVSQVIGSIEEARFNSNTDDQNLHLCFSELAIEPLILHEEELDKSKIEDYFEIEEFGRTVRKKATTIELKIPYSGDYKLWYLHPSVIPYPPPKAVVMPPMAGRPGILVLSLTLENQYATVPAFAEAKERLLGGIKSCLKQQKETLELNDRALKGHLLKDIKERRNRIDQLRGLDQALGITKKKHNPISKPDMVDNQAELIEHTELCPKKEAKFGIEQEEYENILQILRDATGNFEQYPKTFCIHGEEELRNFLLANLNTHKLGKASGETFRNSGKTDIRIQEGNREAFVAECKVWSGPKALQGAVDQLLSYLTWRDDKVALIIFNKTVSEFSSLRKKVPKALKEHPQFVKEISVNPKDPAEWRCVFSPKADKGRQVMVHIILVDIFQP